LSLPILHGNPKQIAGYQFEQNDIMHTSDLKKHILELADAGLAQAPEDFPGLFAAFLHALEAGSIRAAEKIDGVWQVNAWVKRGVLLGFKYGKNVQLPAGDSFQFFDKHTYPTQDFSGNDRNIRIVPGGSTVRSGAYIGKNVTMMPPMYVNCGAYVDDGTMVDSHALVGSCAQIGKRVHLSAAAQIGGVLEPVGATPVVIEDDCMIGGNTGIYEGTQVGEGAVIATGVTLTRSVPVFDLVRQQVYRGSSDEPLRIPAGAVVVAGSRAVSGHDFAEKHGLSIATPIIIKYRDDKTDAATKLEALLR